MKVIEYEKSAAGKRRFSLRILAGYQKFLGVSLQDTVGMLGGESEPVNKSDLGGGIRPRCIGGKEDTGWVVMAQYISAKGAPLGGSCAANGAERGIQPNGCTA